MDKLIMVTTDIGNKNYAHTSGVTKEKLSSHSQLTLEKAKILINETLGVNKYKNLFNNVERFLLESAIYMHDIGKVNPNFQRYKMGNKSVKSTGESSEHSIYSAYIFIAYAFSRKEDYNYDAKDLFWMFSLSIIISCHHSRLSSFCSILEKINDIYADEPEWIQEIFDDLGISFPIDFVDYFFRRIFDRNAYKDVFSSREFYVKSKIACSLLNTSDHIATSEFMTGNKFSFYEPIKDNFSNSEIYKKIISTPIDSYDDGDINKYRSQIDLDVIENIRKNPHEGIYEMELPCGAGKTMASLFAAIELINNDKSKKGICYTSPINNITDQTASFFSQFYPDLQIMTCASDINYDYYKSGEDCAQEILLDYQTHNYNFICTSHINLFSSLFGNRREDSLDLLFLSNRIVILDEVQSVKPQTWTEMINLMGIYSKMLNITFIIMSATLPELNHLVSEKEVHIENLIPDKDKYFNNPIFKNRVEFLVHQNKINNFNEIIKEQDFYSDKNTLYEFQTKKDAREFFEFFRDVYPEIETYELTGDANFAVRAKIINRVQQSIGIVVVSTQVIEAGIDLDFDYGFKDVSKPDSECQFLGRINRSCKKKGFAEFFKYSSYNPYKNNPVSLSSIMDKQIEKAIRDFDNATIYSKTLSYIGDGKESTANEYSERMFNTHYNKMDFKTVSELMKQIDEAKSLYIAYKMEIPNIVNQNDENSKRIMRIYNDINSYFSEYGIFEIVGNSLFVDGKKLYELKKALLRSDTSYAAKMLLIRKINVLSNFFTFTVYFEDDKNLPDNIICPDSENKYVFYTEDEQYILDGCINRKRLRTTNKFL